MFVHRSYPGQFRWMIPELTRKGIEIKFICIEKTDWPIQNIEVVEAKTNGANSLEKIGYDFSDAVLQAAVFLKKKGFVPDVIVAHYGYGLWRAKNIFTSSRLITYCEWMFNDSNRHYHSWGRANEASVDQQVINSLQESSLETSVAMSDIAICPTLWQRNSFNKKCASKIKVVEDGFPETLFYPVSKGKKIHDSKKKLSLLYISRGFEYTRGIDKLFKLIQKLDSETTNYELTIMADNRCVYDQKKDWDLKSTKIYNYFQILDRVSLVGQLPYDQYIDKIRSSDIHLYLSRPFVLSWSFIESSLIGSYIVSVDNRSTLEASHTNHKDFKSIDSLCNMLFKYCKSEDQLSNLRQTKYNWVETDEYIQYKRRFSLKTQINQFLRLCIE